MCTGMETQFDGNEKLGMERKNSNGDMILLYHITTLQRSQNLEEFAHYFVIFLALVVADIRAQTAIRIDK